LRIGVAKEIKTDEYRVALTPAGARELVQRGHEVIVETTAGDGSAFADDDYRRNGASIVSLDDVWEQSELLLKVKEPVEPEYERLREDLVLFTYLHIAADEPLTRALVDSGITAVAYETVETDDRRPPRGAGRRLLPREAARRPRAPARRRARRCAGPRARDRRRRRRLQRRDHRDRARRAGDDPRSVDRPDALPRRDPLRPRQHGDVLDAADRVVDRRRRRRDRRGPRPRRAGAEARHPRHARRHEEGRRDRRRRDRPGRLRRDRAPDDALRPGLRGGRRDALLRREHARRRPDHLDEGADERDTALRGGDRRARARRRRGARAGARAGRERRRRQD